MIVVRDKFTGSDVFMLPDGTVDEDAMLGYLRNKDPSLTELPTVWQYFALAMKIKDWRCRSTGEDGAGDSEHRALIRSAPPVKPALIRPCVCVWCLSCSCWLGSAAAVLSLLSTAPAASAPKPRVRGKNKTKEEKVRVPFCFDIHLRLWLLLVPRSTVWCTLLYNCCTAPLGGSAQVQAGFYCGEGFTEDD